MDLQAVCETAVEIARAAGALLRDGQDAHKLEEHKSSAIDLVTEYDGASEQLIVAGLRAAFPEHGIVGEEGAAQAAAEQLCWYVDPLDGTVNYAHGLPIYAVSLGLWDGARPLVGVVYNPALEHLFTAVAGVGSWLQQGERRRPLRVSSRDRLLTALLGTGFPYDRHTSPHDNVAQMAAFLKQAQGIRRAGAAALDLCYVAAGWLDGYWEFKLHSWDVAAGALIVQEAGGRVSRPDGAPLVLDDRIDLVASNGRIHAEMLRVLAATPPPAGNLRLFH